MGRMVKVKEFKTGTKYKLWSTITDSYVNEKWLTRDEMIKFCFWEKFYKFMSDVMEDVMTFPHGYSDKDSWERIIMPDVSREFNKFMLESLDDEVGFYSRVKEELNKLNIELFVKDEEYGFDSRTNRENK